MKTNAQRQAEYRARKRNAVTPVTLASVTTVTPPVTVDSNTCTPDQSPVVGDARPVSEVSQVSQSVKCETVEGKEGKGEACRVVEGEPHATILSCIAMPVEIKKSKSIETVEIIPKSAPRPPPATREQMDKAIEVMRSGGLNRDVLASGGLSSWQQLNLGGIQHYGVRGWGELTALWTTARANRIIDRAQAVVMQDEPAAVSEASGPLGVTRTEKRETTAPMVAAAMAGLLPEVHGKLANGKGGAITVNGNAAIFGGPPPAGTLDDWTPAGLLP